MWNKREQKLHKVNKSLYAYKKVKLDSKQDDYLNLIKILS